MPMSLRKSVQRFLGWTLQTHFTLERYGLASRFAPPTTNPRTTDHTTSKSKNKSYYDNCASIHNRCKVQKQKETLVLTLDDHEQWFFDSESGIRTRAITVSLLGA